MIQKVNTPGISSPVFPCFSPEIWSMFIQFWRPPRPPWPPWLRKSLRRGTTETARAARAGRSRSGATGRCCWEFWEVFWYFFWGKSWPKFGNEGGQSNCYNQMVNFWKHVDIMWRWDTEKNNICTCRDFVFIVGPLFHGNLNGWWNLCGSRLRVSCLCIRTSECIVSASSDI